MIQSVITGTGTVLFFKIVVYVNIKFTFFWSSNFLFVGGRLISGW